MSTLEKKIVKGQFVVKNVKGLHTRPCTELVKCANGFYSDIVLSYRKHRVNAKSILGILMLAAQKGARVRVEAHGVDADDAINSILVLAEAQFHIKY